MNASIPSSVHPPHAAQNPLIWFELSFVFVRVRTCVPEAVPTIDASRSSRELMCRRPAGSRTTRLPGVRTMRAYSASTHGHWPPTTDSPPPTTDYGHPQGAAFYEEASTASKSCL